MDMVPFFRVDSKYPAHSIRRWLFNRSSLVISGQGHIHPARLSYLIKEGYLDSVTQIIVYDCNMYGEVISQLADLKITSLKLVDHRMAVGQCGIEDYETRVVQNNLDDVVDSIRKMTKLKTLDIEVDAVISGRKLLFLQGMKGLKNLRLRGFDFSEGIKYIGSLVELENLHLCHGNFFSSPEKDVNEEDLLDLSSLLQVKSVHLEGFDRITDLGVKPFCRRPVTKLVLKHCQCLSGESCSIIGAMTSLNALHIINSAYDDVEDFETEHLLNLLPLKDLKSISLFYVLINQYSIMDLVGLDDLETLNVAFKVDLSQDEFNILCNTILPLFPSLKKVRIFGEDCMERKTFVGDIEVEFGSFNLGDVVELE